MNEMNKYTEKLFEDIKHIDENENEYYESFYSNELEEY